jgi:hypothetical protein
MESRATERNSLSVFFGKNVPGSESHATTQQVPNPSFRTASRPLHTGYIRPLHMIGVEAKSAKFSKISEEDFWDAKDGSLSPMPDVEKLPATAAKSAKYQDAAPEKWTTLGTFGKTKNYPAMDLESVDSILNRVRPGITLNRVQSTVRDCIFTSNESALVGAPTGKKFRVNTRIIVEFIVRLRKNCSNGNGHLQIVSTIIAGQKSDSKSTVHCSNQAARHREKAGMGEVSCYSSVMKPLDYVLIDLQLLRMSWIKSYGIDWRYINR